MQNKMNQKYLQQHKTQKILLALRAFSLLGRFLLNKPEDQRQVVFHSLCRKF